VTNSPQQFFLKHFKIIFSELNEFGNPDPSGTPVFPMPGNFQADFFKVLK